MNASSSGISYLSDEMKEKLAAGLATRTGDSSDAESESLSDTYQASDEEV